MRYVLACLLAPILTLSACKNADDAGQEGDSAASADPVGSYDIDPESGEIRATHTDAQGVTTTMRAGEKVQARFPEPFTAYPGADITNTTRVEQGDGTFVTIEFTTSDPREEVVRFYREQAEQAAIDPDVEVTGGATTTLGGENSDAGLSFALQVTRVSALTEGQLSVASGFD